MADTYCLLRLKGADRNWQPLKDALDESVAAKWQEAGWSVWGTFHGLFGVGSNEMLVMLASASGGNPARLAEPLDGIAEVVKSEVLEPTVRPTNVDPCERPGLYVFRYFAVPAGNVEEVAALSREAWETFENVSSYEAEPQGLFAPQDRSADTCNMLLVTWYDGLDSWQTSRKPAPEAQANFRRRHELTRSTIAFATRLVA